MPPRALPEWIGEDQNEPVPPRVRLRNFREHGGICHLTGQVISATDQWQTDHVVAIIDGGANRESNLAPALLSAHQAKTSGEVTRKAAIDARAKSHLGIDTPKKTGLEGRTRVEKHQAKILKTVESGKIQQLPRRSLYGPAEPSRPSHMLALPAPKRASR